MVKYVLKRLLIAVATVFVLASLTFFLMKAIPGDPFLNNKVPQSVQDLQRSYYGLDKPVLEQYATYMNNLLHGDLGTSLKKTGKTVVSIIGETFPVSAALGLFSLFFASMIGILFGILCAQYRGHWPDYLLMIVAVAGVALPSMIVGPCVRFLFGVKLGWLPTTGWGTLSQLIMPSFCLGLGLIANLTRGMRASMLSVITQDYIKTARAKGLTKGKIVLRHELKNSLIPIVTNLGVSVASVMMGSFVIEKIFLIPGLGKYFVDSITTMDYPLIMGTTIFYGALLVGMNMIVDIIYGFLDPRIRIQ